MENFDKAKSGSDLAVGRRTTPVPDLGFDVLGGLLPQLGICVLAFDDTGRTIWSTPGLEDMLGTIPATTAELAAILTSEPDRLDDLTEGLARVRGAPEPFSMEIPGVACASGTHTCTLTAFSATKGDTRLLVVFLKDVTLETLMRRELEVLERQASVGRIAAGTAHELNNIITAMLGWAQIAKRTPAGDRRAEKALDTLEQSAQRARQIAAQLLTASRPAEPSLRRLAAERPLNDALSLLGWELNEGRVELSRDCEPELAIRGDGTRLVQLFVNLVRNAIEAMPGGGRLWASIARRGDAVEYVLADDGTGIDPAIADRIFEPFFSSKPRMEERETGGSGLGLAIAAKIVEEHGGAIGAAANEHGGTSITVALPLAAEDVAEPSEAPATRSSFPPGVAVLVVDDDLDIREMISTALTLRGARVAIAASGDDAVELCREQPFDAAFVDYSMLGLSGHELGQALARVRPEMPIVFMSGREVADNGDAHVIDFLKKPFDLGEIQRKLRQVLDRRANNGSDD